MSPYRPSDVGSPYGAPMGRRNCLPDDTGAPIKLRLERMRLDSGGYDSGGAYWGGPSTMWVAHHEEEGYEFFVRAPDREAAKAKVRERLPLASFWGRQTRADLDVRIQVALKGTK